MRNAALIVSPALLLGLVLLIGGCQSSHQEGVKSNMHTQWTTVAADTKTATEAAKDELKAEGLLDVKAASTNVDGQVTGKKADGTKVTVAVVKKGDKSSEVSVNVGTMGDPSLGAELARKIKDRAEGR
jgi:hypothetical protein